MNEISDFFDRMAPSWDERGKHDKALVDNLLSSCQIRKGDALLDLGCGTGVISKKLSLLSQSKVLCMDASEKMISIAKEKYSKEKLLSFIHEDFYSFDGGKFDKIICFDAYPHFTDILSFKKKAYGLLKDHGRLCILHDLSRKALEHCHSGHASSLSRIIEKPEKEAQFYLDCFKIILAEEDDSSYRLILEKTNEQKKTEDERKDL